MQLSDQGPLRPLDTQRRHRVLLKLINLLGLLLREVPQVADLALRVRRRYPKLLNLFISRRQLHLQAWMRRPSWNCSNSTQAGL
jgi:hypothetical protein